MHSSKPYSHRPAGKPATSRTTTQRMHSQQPVIEVNSGVAEDADDQWYRRHSGSMPALRPITADLAIEAAAAVATLDDDPEPYLEFDARPTEEIPAAYVRAISETAPADVEDDHEIAAMLALEVLMAPRDTNPCACGSCREAMTRQAITVLNNGAITYKSVLGDLKSDLADSELFIKYCPFGAGPDGKPVLMDEALSVEPSPEPGWCCKHSWRAEAHGRLDTHGDSQFVGLLMDAEGGLQYAICPGCGMAVGELKLRRPLMRLA